MSCLQSNDGVERTKAREALVKIGKPAAPYIMVLLSHPDEHIRWEACKALERIRDPKTALLLARRLMDDNMDVRWVAADALIELEQHAIVPVLEIIEEQFDSPMLREAAHHVLHSLKELHLLDQNTKKVLDALKNTELPSKAAFTANRALDYFRSHKAVKHHSGAG
jgi:HEAT repeat protein